MASNAYSISASYLWLVLVVNTKMNALDVGVVITVVEVGD